MSTGKSSLILQIYATHFAGVHALLSSPNVILCSFCMQTSHHSYCIPSLVSCLVPLSHPECVLKSLSLPLTADPIKGWM